MKYITDTSEVLVHHGVSEQCCLCIISQQLC
jgi:hypothetical protein